jgi:hypothetical protein
VEVEVLEIAAEEVVTFNLAFVDASIWLVAGAESDERCAVDLEVLEVAEALRRTTFGLPPATADIVFMGLRSVRGIDVYWMSTFVAI